MAKSKTRRNLILIVVLFVLAGGAVFSARSLRPRQLIGPEPAEIQRARLSKTENGYFLLRDAQKALKPVAVRNLVRDADFEPGPKAELLDLSVREDAEEVAEAIEGSRPIVDAVREALAMPYLLRPIDWENDFEGEGWLVTHNPYELLSIFPRVFLVGIEEAQRGNFDEAIGIIEDYYRLAWRFTDEVGVSYTTAGKLLQMASLVRECPVDFQDRLKERLQELRRNWQPPKYAFDTQLRIVAAQTPGLHYLPLLLIFDFHRKALRARPVIGANLNELRKVSGYDLQGYKQWAGKNPELAEAAESLLIFMFSLENICHTNSRYLDCLDGMCAMIAVEQYKRDNGTYPEALSQLVPEYLDAVPQESACNCPLTYGRDGGDYFLYMLGNGCKDQGGQRYHSCEVLIHVPEKGEGALRE